MNNNLKILDSTRLEVSRKISNQNRASLGQYLTPYGIASFMSSLFTLPTRERLRILDAGAGIGSLSIALFERILESDTKAIEWTGYEIDSTMVDYLKEFISAYEKHFLDKKIDFKGNIIQKDFIESGIKDILFHTGPRYDIAVLNPPYKKILSDSRFRLLLREAKIETVNLYTAFLAIVIKLMDQQGQIVAIIPRSFCNGPYYKPFRKLLLSLTAIRHIHLFGARDKAFKDDGVLQENIILVLEKQGKQNNVKISTSTDDSFQDYKELLFPFERIVMPNDPEVFIHIPTTIKQSNLKISNSFHYTLDDLNIKVSTGPVVDFRVKEHLRSMPTDGTVPLLYPIHFSGEQVEWPIYGKKPNAVIMNEVTRRWLYPNGFYVIVRRFSSKEERKRIVASVIDPNMFDAVAIGIENHLNVFHTKKNGLEEDIARGLAIFLNSTIIDDYFRRFSGHTQVNANDLKLLRYPSHEILKRLGSWARSKHNLTQESIDRELEKYA